METLYRKETEEKDDKAQAGGLAALLGRLGIGAAGGGAGTTLTGNAALYGLLASKGGIVALILTGTTVAAGVGVVGSQLGLFSPAEVQEQQAGTVFEEAEAQVRRRTERTAPRSTRNGISESLEYLVRANVKRHAAYAPTPVYQHNQRPAADAVANRNLPGNSDLAAQLGAQFDGQRGPGRAQNTQPVGEGFARPQLKPQAGLSGGIGKSFQPVFRAALPEASAPSNPAPAAAPSAASQSSGYGTGRLGLKSSGNRAADQLTDANRTEKVNLHSEDVSSPASGATYDGGSAKAMAPLHLNAFVWRGPASVGNGAGSGSDAGGLSANESGLSSMDITPPAPAKPKPAENKTPWQWAVNVAMAGMAMATLAFLAMSYFKKMGNLLFAQMAAAVATAAGSMVSAMGLLLMSTYKQQLQGAEWAAIGAITAAMAARNLANLLSNDSKDYRGAAQDQGEQSSAQMNNLLQAPAMPPPMGSPSSQAAPQSPQSQAPSGIQSNSGIQSGGASSQPASEPQPGPGSNAVSDPTQVDPTDPNTVITSQGG